MEEAHRPAVDWAVNDDNTKPRHVILVLFLKYRNLSTHKLYSHFLSYKYIFCFLSIYTHHSNANAKNKGVGLVLSSGNVILGFSI